MHEFKSNVTWVSATRPPAPARGGRVFRLPAPHGGGSIPSRPSRAIPETISPPSASPWGLRGDASGAPAALRRPSHGCTPAPQLPALAEGPGCPAFRAGREVSARRAPATRPWGLRGRGGDTHPSRGPRTQRRSRCAGLGERLRA